MALLGKEAVPEGAPKKKEEEDSEDDIESSEEEDHEVEEHFSDDSDSSIDDDEGEDSDNEKDQVKGGTDLLMTDTIDIPRVDNIPVISQLAKEKKIENSGRSKLVQLAIYAFQVLVDVLQHYRASRVALFKRFQPITKFIVLQFVLVLESQALIRRYHLLSPSGDPPRQNRNQEAAASKEHTNRRIAHLKCKAAHYFPPFCSGASSWGSTSFASSMCQSGGVEQPPHPARSEEHTTARTNQPRTAVTIFLKGW